MNRVRELRNPIRDYAWGSRTALSELLGVPNPGGRPQAELWMGAHPSAPSRVVGEAGEVPLDAWIERDPVAVLGARVARRFEGKLPFLFKVLAAEQPLSIQAHPSLAQARQGHAREEAAGIPLDAPQRCYRDANHKPELLCALTRFRALDRFRPVAEILEHLEALGAPELSVAQQALTAGAGPGLREAFRRLMELADGPLAAVLERAATRAAAESGDLAAWADVLRLAEAHPGDVGVLAPLFLNVVELQPSEAIYLPAGELHSYLGGVGVEIMANSDNVLRGGLTPKHVDVPELLETLSFAAGAVEVLQPEGLASGAARYATPAEEFELGVLEVSAEAPFASAAARDVEILLCTRGEARLLEGGGNALPVTRGSCLLVPAAAPAYRLEGAATLYRATVGLPAADRR